MTDDRIREIAEDVVRKYGATYGDNIRKYCKHAIRIALAEPSETDEEQADVRAAWFEVQQHLCPQQAGGYSSYFEAAKVIVQMHTSLAEHPSPYHYEIRGQYVICMCDKCVASRAKLREWVPVGSPEQVMALVDNANKSLDEFPWKDWSPEKVRALLNGLHDWLPAPPREPKE